MPAFVARPHVAAGVAKAADDAAALAAALEVDDVAPALQRFEAARLPVGQRIIERARHLGAYLQATQTAEERARSQRHSIPGGGAGGDRGARFLAGVSAADRRRGPTGRGVSASWGALAGIANPANLPAPRPSIPANGAGRAYVAVQVARMLLAAASEVIE